MTFIDLNTVDSRRINPSNPFNSFNPFNHINNYGVIINKPVEPKISLGEAFKPVQAGKKQSHVVFILDDSGSMSSCRDTTISGFNEFLGVQRRDAIETGIPTFISLYKFDGSTVNNTIVRESIESVQDLNRDSYNPRGGTNLRDAIGGVLMDINKQLSVNTEEDRDSVIVVILTDGEENSSRVFSQQDIKLMVSRSQDANWGFMFMGANIDAFSVGSTYGFDKSATIQFTNASAHNSMSSAAEMTTRLRSAYSKGMDTTMAYASSAFSDEERIQAMVNDHE